MRWTKKKVCDINHKHEAWQRNKPDRLQMVQRDFNQLARMGASDNLVLEAHCH